MSLIDAMMEDCVLVDKVRTSDGEGGFDTQWLDGAQFRAAITVDTTMQARIAEKQGVTSVYTITTQRGVNLEFHDVVKRVSDGAIFRVTTDGKEKQSPIVSSLDIEQVSAEKWSLPT